MLKGNILVVSNDDDFGVVDNGNCGFSQKVLPSTKSVWIEIDCISLK